MPNWCSNNITITGPVETIEKLWTTATADDGSGENRETGLLEALAPQGELNYRERLLSNWGTKWDVSTEGLDITVNDGTASISGWFDSAWTPPLEAYTTFLRNNDDVSIEASYHEPGNGFGGIYTNGDDECQEDLSEQYNLAEEDRSELYNLLDDEYNLSEQYQEMEMLDD